MVTVLAGLAGHRPFRHRYRTPGRGHRTGRDPAAARELLAGGAAGFLAKPFTVPEFIATLDRFLVPPAG